jgi:hypothetical protein
MTGELRTTVLIRVGDHGKSVGKKNTRRQMRILTRREWGASVSPGYARGEGISEVWMHHSVTIADDDYSFEGVNDVVKDMKEIERIGKSRFGVFPYSFCIHPSGVVGEGAES